MEQRVPSVQGHLRGCPWSLSPLAQGAVGSPMATFLAFWTRHLRRLALVEAFPRPVARFSADPASVLASAGTGQGFSG